MKNLLVLLAIPALAFAGPVKHKAPEPAFKHYPVKHIYRGKNALPQFKGRDKEFRLYRTILTSEVKSGPNFAGNYRVIQIGCGTGCTDAYIANNKTGQIFRFPRSGEKNLYLQFTNQITSRLLRVQWGDTHNNACLQEYFTWNGRTTKLLGTKKIGDLEYCYSDIHSVR